ncbi:helix-hairpin-helix domain-containing protein [Ligilactobacillus apodemi]|uniref:helix-hairpin-helix domain-containing protein n=1 Tax=Ligilactobacillus apodemi TaxID=307126 RepID=UPI00214BEA2A|nr:helix-hairpin-helix domain-containing protein [Ligilactobacillus apodemi]MCR1900971.1 helix-hairpin-helix domain-containing protein [Ligilactobacillus apodemi]
MEKLVELFEKYKMWLILLGVSVFGVVSVFYLMFSPSAKEESFKQISSNKVARVVNSNVANSSSKTHDIYVDIKGAVKQPGLYRISASKRVGDAIALAGGVTEQADISQVNYAKKLTDQMLIYVIKKGESNPNSSTVSNAALATADSTSTDKIDLNIATKEQLMQVDGIGEKKADKIIEYREQHGGFKQLSDLKNISGIGEKTYQKLVDHLKI